MIDVPIQLGCVIVGPIVLGEFGDERPRDGASVVRGKAVDDHDAGTDGTQAFQAPPEVLGFVESEYDASEHSSILISYILSNPKFEETNGGILRE